MGTVAAHTLFENESGTQADEGMVCGERQWGNKLGMARLERGKRVERRRRKLYLNE